MSPQQELLPLCPHHFYTSSHFYTHSYTLCLERHLAQAGCTEPGTSLEAREPEQNHHLQGLLPLAVVCSPAQAAGKFQFLSFGVRLDWLTIGQR